MVKALAPRSLRERGANKSEFYLREELSFEFNGKKRKGAYLLIGKKAFFSLS